MTRIGTTQDTVKPVEGETWIAPRLDGNRNIVGGQVIRVLSHEDNRPIGGAWMVRAEILKGDGSWWKYHLAGELFGIWEPDAWLKVSFGEEVLATDAETLMRYADAIATQRIVYVA